MAKCCRMYTLHFTRYTLKISNFCESVREYKWDLLRVNWTACNISVVLTTDTSLLAIIFSVTCNRNWLYSAHPVSSHATHWQVKTPVKTPLIGFNGRWVVYLLFEIFYHCRCASVLGQNQDCVTSVACICTVYYICS